MRFLVDAQLPSALARWLAAEGYQAEHVSDCGLENARDTKIWLYAQDKDAVIITKDEDFALMRALKTEGPAVLWLRLGNTRKAALLSWFEPLLPDIIVALERGEVLLEVS